MAKETDFEHPPRGHVALLYYDVANDRFQVVQGDDVDAAIPATAKAPLASTLAHGYDGSAWRKQPTIWGYTQSAGEIIATTSNGDAAIYHTFVAVAPGYVRHVDLVVGMDTSNTFTYLEIQAYLGGAWRAIWRLTPGPAGPPEGLYSAITLGPGENLRVRYQGTTDLDSLRSVQVGYDMAIGM